jgi:hypothetical protein
VEEAGVKLAMTRLYGRAPQGARGVGTGPPSDGDTSTRLGALAPQGMQAGMTVNGATDAEGFRADVKPGLGPTLGPGAIVVLEHRSAPQAVGVPPALARRGARRLSGPPHAPDLSPLDLGVSPQQTAWRAAKAWTRDALESARRAALDTITAREAGHGFRHGGYPS